MRILTLSTIFLFAFISFTFGETIRVPQDYPTIQWAVAEAQTGDTVEVSMGTYGENIVVYQKGITIRRADEPGRMTIKNPGGGYQTKCCIAFISCAEYGPCVLDGFEVTNGEGVLYHHDVYDLDFCVGGGVFIYNSEVSILNCSIHGNEVTSGDLNFGGGIGVECEYYDERDTRPYEDVYSKVIIEDCEIHENYLEDLVFGWSNGEACWLNALLPGSRFSRNTVRDNYSYVPVDDDETAVCLIGDCSEFDSNIFLDNDYSALYTVVNFENSEFVMTNSVFEGHGRYGLLVMSNDQWCVNCTFRNNVRDISLCSMYYPPHNAELFLYNTAMWDPYNWSVKLWDEDDELTIDYCTIWSMPGWDNGISNYGGTVNYGGHNVNYDPMINATWHLLRGSPCINAGTAYYHAPSHDFEGDLRDIPDIGADER